MNIPVLTFINNGIQQYLVGFKKIFGDKVIMKRFLEVLFKSQKVKMEIKDSPKPALDGTIVFVYHFNK